MSLDTNSAEYKRSAAQARQILELMQLCFANMQICMRISCYQSTETASPKIAPEILAKAQEESAKKVQETFDRFLDNDDSSQGFEIITKIGKALSEEFIMDYFAEQKKHAKEPTKA
jgi:hypothetical protein